MAKKVKDKVTMDLEGELAGFSIEIDPNQITLGFFEDLESPRMADNLNALSDVIVGGNLPHGTDRAGLRKLKPEQFTSVATGLSAALKISKNA